jgi:O-antigen/teichoic acid export membrane protein
MFLTMGITLYTSRVVLSILGISDYGLYNVVGGIVVVLSFLNGALSSATSRFLTFELGIGNQQRLQNIFSASFCLHVLVSLFILLIGETIGLWFLYNKLTIPVDRMDAAFWVYQISLLNVMITLTQTPYNAAIISHEKMNIYAYVSIGESVCKLLMIYILSVLLIDKLILYAILLFSVSLLVSLYYRYYCAQHFTECRLKLFWDKKLYVRLLSYSGWDLFGNIAVVCQGQGLNILLNMFCGTGVNAARAITYQVYAAVNSFVGNFLIASRPQIIKSYARKNIDEMYRLMFMTTKYSSFLLTLII